MKKQDFNLKGKAFKFGNNIDTDQIIPARYLDTSDPEELAKHCMEGVDKNFSAKVKKGDIIVAGKNFGCGSSREHAPASIKGCGVGAVIARSFARIFYRNAINIGLPIIECENLECDTGNEIYIDFKKGIVKNLSKKKNCSFGKFPEFLTRIISAGGLMNKIKKDYLEKR
ncbi:MAG: 3-isopropylmalate dehydratase small subunit [Elusimicrobiota bacterium]